MIFIYNNYICKIGKNITEKNQSRKKTLTYDEEVNYCRTCGMPLEKGRTLCKGCGAEVETEAKKAKEEPKEKKPTTEHIKETLSEVADEISTTVKKTPTNSLAAIVLGVFGCFTGCFILPIVGLSVVRRAEENNEDPKMVNIARLLNGILIGISVLVLIGIVLAIVLPLTVFA